jgi:hypothetical protein
MTELTHQERWERDAAELEREAVEQDAATIAVAEAESTEPTTMDRAQEILSRLPARRWRALQIRFDLSVKELGEDPVAMLIIMAHEHWRVTNQEQGNPPRDDWDRFESMSLGELNDYLGIKRAATKSGEAAPVPSV